MRRFYEGPSNNNSVMAKQQSNSAKKVSIPEGCVAADLGVAIPDNLEPFEPVAVGRWGVTAKVKGENGEFVRVKDVNDLEGKSPDDCRVGFLPRVTITQGGRKVTVSPYVPAGVMDANGWLVSRDGRKEPSIEKIGLRMNLQTKRAEFYV